MTKQNMTKLTPDYFWQLLKTEIYNNRYLPAWMQPAKRLPRSFKFRHFKKRGLTLNISGLSPALAVRLSADGNLRVTAHWAGEFDFLYDSELHAGNDAQGYYCQLCEARRYYPEYLPLWHEHVLQSFISWCESNLLTADRILFFGAETGLVIACLVQRNSIKDNSRAHILPLWQPSTATVAIPAA